MAAVKKDFSKVNDRVQNALADAVAEDAPETQETQKERKERRTYTKEEAQEFLSDFRTAGHKGVKLPRVNMAFTPDNYEFIRVMSRVRGENMTEFVNVLVKKYMEEYRDIYDKALQFKDSI